MAHAASTALPSFWKMAAPAVAASGLPVMAIQWRPCRTGFTVRCASVPVASTPKTATRASRPAVPI